MKAARPIEALLARGAMAVLRAAGWRRSLAVGAALGEAAGRLGVRRRTAAANLALAFPERTVAERERLLGEHYRELGRVVAEYARLAELVHAAPGEVVAEARGLEHLDRGRAAGRGAILLSGHFGNFELLGAFLGRMHPTDFVVRPLANPAVEAMIARERAAAGMATIKIGAGARRVYASLRANRWVAMLADQDARGHGVFVPFLGRPTSTPTGPARIALATGAALIMGFITRRPDGRHEIVVEPPLAVPEPDAPDAARRLTALHAARLEAWVRRRPESWFWLHRRWKTRPPGGACATGAGAGT